MGLELVGTILAALVAAGAAIYTARATRKSNEASSQREFQVEFLRTLSSEVEKLNERVATLRAQLVAAETACDLERSRRRAVELELEGLIDTLQSIQARLRNLPIALEDPQIRRFLELNLERPRSQD